MAALSAEEVYDEATVLDEQFRIWFGLFSHRARADAAAWATNGTGFQQLFLAPYAAGSMPTWKAWMAAPAGVTFCVTEVRAGAQ